MGGGGGNSGPTLQQQQLETEQSLTNANLNLEENSQRKSILNAMMGTRVFAGSALSRAMRGNTPGTGGATGGPASAAQTSSDETPVVTGQASLLDQRQTGSGATSAGGTGASASSGVATGGGGIRGAAGGGRL